MICSSMIDQDPTTCQATPIRMAHLKNQERRVEKSDTAHTARKQKTEGVTCAQFKSPKVGQKVRKQTKKKVKSGPPGAGTGPSYIKSLVVLCTDTSEQIISCLCSTIRNTAVRNIKEMRTCIGILVSNNIRHRVCVPRASPISARILPLAELLSLPNHRPPKKERLKLGVRLASSVLQLHRTKWLQERWGNQDIYLIQGDYSQTKKGPSLEIPVVRQVFTPEHSVPEVSVESHIIGCNLSLFSLGIVLIELWFWRSVEPKTYCSLKDLDIARLVTAKRLIGDCMKTQVIVMLMLSDVVSLV